MYTWQSTEMNVHRIAMMQELSKARKALAAQEQKVEKSEPSPTEPADHGPPALVELSPWVLAAANGSEDASASGDDRRDPAEKTTPWDLGQEEKAQVEELRKTDAKVRAHEMAHASSGAATSAPSYEYQTGPDGKRYAVAGHVDVDTSPGATPEQTVAKARQIRAAAMAPTDPSPQDRSVAAEASRMEADAMAQIAERGREELGRAMERIGSGADGKEEDKDSLTGSRKPAFHKFLT